MGIIAAHTAPNFAFGNYFRILRAEFLCAPGMPEAAWQIMLGFYANVEARDLNSEPMYVHSVTLLVGSELPSGHVVEDPRSNFLYDLVMQSKLFHGTNAAPHIGTGATEPTENLNP